VLIARRFWLGRPGRARPRVAAPELQQWRALLARMDARVRRLGFVRAPSETLHQFARRIAGDEGIDLPSELNSRELLAQWYVEAATVRYDGPVAPHRLEQLHTSLDSVR